jgi:hypothetical protein
LQEEFGEIYSFAPGKTPGKKTADKETRNDEEKINADIPQWKDFFKVIQCYNNNSDGSEYVYGTVPFRRIQCAERLQVPDAARQG